MLRLLSLMECYVTSVKSTSLNVCLASTYLKREFRFSSIIEIKLRYLSLSTGLMVSLSQSMPRLLSLMESYVTREKSTFQNMRPGSISSRRKCTPSVMLHNEKKLIDFYILHRKKVTFNLSICPGAPGSLTLSDGLDDSVKWSWE